MFGLNTCDLGTKEDLDPLLTILKVLEHLLQDYIAKAPLSTAHWSAVRSTAPWSAARSMVPWSAASSTAPLRIAGFFSHYRSRQ